MLVEKCQNNGRSSLNFWFGETTAFYGFMKFYRGSDKIPPLEFGEKS